MVSINGTPTTTDDNLGQIMRGLKVGSTIKLRLFREGKYRNVQYALPERPLLPSDLPSECEDDSSSSAARIMRKMRMRR